MQRLLPLTKALGFSMGSLALLVVGCLGAQILWHRQHHRYEQPRTGAYSGAVHAHFSSSDSTFALSFEGETSRHWYWAFPTNFTYNKLSLEWHSYVNDSGGKAILSLPDFQYQSGGSTGVLSYDVLATWLLGETNTSSVSTSDASQVERLLGYLEAAAEGTLPPPNHHGYSFGYESKEPLFGRIQHFRLGIGIAETVFVWIPAWAVITVVLARMLFKSPTKRSRQQPSR